MAAGGKGQCGNGLANTQVPKPLPEIPMSKSQIPMKSQNPMSNEETPKPRPKSNGPPNPPPLDIESWTLGFHWDLGSAHWDFPQPALRHRKFPRRPLPRHFLPLPFRLRSIHNFCRGHHEFTRNSATSTRPFRPLRFRAGPRLHGHERVLRTQTTKRRGIHPRHPSLSRSRW
jgi:hypothetical protein